MERDPRTDPRAGDVLERPDGETRRVDGYYTPYVFYVVRQRYGRKHARRTTVTKKTSFTDWRIWAKSATVIRKAEDHG